jgi:hypothetical protein
LTRERGESGFNLDLITHHASYSQAPANLSGPVEGGTLLPDGSIQTVREDGTVITRGADGSTTIQRSDGTFILNSAAGVQTVMLLDGTIIVTLSDGTIVTIMPDGRVITALPGGSMETISEDKEAEGPFGVDQDISMMKDLQNLTESNKKQGVIELGSLVAGLTGWGVAGFSVSSDNSPLDREGFERLEKDTKIRRFLRWSEGRFVKNTREKYGEVDRKKLH